MNTRSAPTPKDRRVGAGTHAHGGRHRESPRHSMYITTRHTYHRTIHPGTGPLCGECTDARPVLPLPYTTVSSVQTRAEECRVQTRRVRRRARVHAPCVLAWEGCSAFGCHEKSRASFSPPPPLCRSAVPYPRERRNKELMGRRAQGERTRRACSVARARPAERLTYSYYSAPRYLGPVAESSSCQLVLSIIVIAFPFSALPH